MTDPSKVSHVRLSDIKPSPRNCFRTDLADAVRRATTTELQYRILLMESAASPKALRVANRRMLKAQVFAIGGEPDATPQDSKGRQDERRSS
jgi:hypothetical protein